jgi:hypothetical protein
MTLDYKMSSFTLAARRVRTWVSTDRSRAEKLWLECGIIDDDMLCDRERDIPPGQKI